MFRIPLFGSPSGGRCVALKVTSKVGLKRVIRKKANFLSHAYYNNKHISNTTTNNNNNDNDNNHDNDNTSNCIISNFKTRSQIPYPTHIIVCKTLVKPEKVLRKGLFWKLSTKARKVTNGVSANGVTANLICFDRGIFWVPPLAYFDIPNKSARAHLFPPSAKNHVFCSSLVSVDPILWYICYTICI